MKALKAGERKGERPAPCLWFPAWVRRRCWCRRNFIVPFVLVLLWGCSGEQLPPGAQLRLAPASRTFEIVETVDTEGRCISNSFDVIDMPLTLQLSDASGAPIGDARVSTYVDFSGTTFSGVPALALYKDLDGNGVVSGEHELVSGVDDEIARFTTARLSGDALMLLRVNVSCPYQALVFSYASGVSTMSSISVVAVETLKLDGNEQHAK